MTCCITHHGPHWLYMDFLDRENNLQLLEHAVRCAESASWHAFNLALYAYMQADQARLQEKQRNMAREDAIKGEASAYPYSLLGIDGRVRQCEEKRRQLWDRLLGTVKIPPNLRLA